MVRKRHTAEQIVAKFRQADVVIAQDQQVADAIRAMGAAKATDYRRRNEYGGLKDDQVKRSKELETENTRLRHAVCGQIALRGQLAPREQLVRLDAMTAASHDAGSRPPRRSSG